VEIIAQATKTFKLHFAFIPVPRVFPLRNNNLKCAVRGMFIQSTCSFCHGW